ncbi:hypothetical protein Hthe01_20520 [Hydrogenophilus thermoluteolus]|nr:hypothetical protein Hthe01_20520 [Hydrogenophilus thermoluteolus]
MANSLQDTQDTFISRKGCQTLDQPVATPQARSLSLERPLACGDTPQAIDSVTGAQAPGRSGG